MKKGPTYKTIAWAVLMVIISFSCKKNEKISFNDQVRPILNDNCLVCHGGVKQLGGFSLLFPETAFGETESGKPAIVPGNHKKSELYRRLIHHDPEQRMPQEAPALRDEEINLIAQWIDEGAEWEDHWAYVSPQPVIPPEINSGWVRNDIDRFILDKLNASGLTPADESSLTTLARRASFDLTGLPPSPALMEHIRTLPKEVSFEMLLDSLLSSPHYGERWASMWLDLARYADSHGYEADYHRDIWRYRDWVIQAFNEDMPFDQFTIEQLAGDLLPNPTHDQLVATAFNRNTMTNTEGGTIDEEFRIASVMDRLNTTFEVWQSTSMGCVQCHSHPYDPFKQEEYYQLMAFFNNTQDADLNSMAPTLPSWQEEDAGKIRNIINYISALNGAPEIDENSGLVEQVDQALFPRLNPQWCDDFQHVVLYNDGGVSNFVYNYSEGLEKRYFFQFNDIPLDGLKAIRYNFATKGTDAMVRVYADKLDGPLINEVRFPMTSKQGHREKQEFKEEAFPAMAKTGKHHLVFELINTTAKAPDGLVNIKSIELIFDNDTEPELKGYQDKLQALTKKADLTPVMKAKIPGFTRTTRVFDRGGWQSPRDTVEAQLPQTLKPEQGPIEPDRLAFARWMVSKENPLTARVIVNRIWEQIFGTGIVLTVEDFGTQAETATHPELLDYLALKLMNEHQWSIKSLLKEILLSSSYRQSSQVTTEKLEMDPYNRLLSRGARFRLSAEQIRDQALAVSGLLDRTIGGKSVMPPQPDGIWQVIYNSQKWVTRQEDRHRRGLYTYWKRTSPYPSMVSFDSPSREFCVSRRIRTNTPMQALVTMNDPVYIEAARALAAKMKAIDTGIREAIAHGYQLALVRKPSDITLEALEALYKEAALSQSAMKFQPVVNNGEDDQLMDPMTVVANAIMNLDGFLMKE
jgi:hypothetical protein